MRIIVCPYLSVLRSGVRYQKLYIEWSVPFGNHTVMETVDSYHHDKNNYQLKIPFSLFPFFSKIILK